MKPYFVRVANPLSPQNVSPGKNNVIPFPQQGKNNPQEEFDASYPGVSDFDKDVAFGREDPANGIGFHGDTNYRPAGEY